MALLTNFSQNFIVLKDGKVLGVHQFRRPSTSAVEIALPPLLGGNVANVATSDSGVTITVAPGGNTRQLQISGGTDLDLLVVTLHGNVGSFDA